MKSNKIPKTNTDTDTDKGIQNYLLFAKEGLVVLPEGFEFEGSKFSQKGNDIIIDSASQQHVIVRHFFNDELLPSLKDTNGEIMNGVVAGLNTSLSNRMLKALNSIVGGLE